MNEKDYANRPELGEISYFCYFSTGKKNTFTLSRLACFECDT